MFYYIFFLHSLDRHMGCGRRQAHAAELRGLEAEAPQSAQRRRAGPHHARFASAVASAAGHIAIAARIAITP